MSKQQLSNFQFNGIMLWAVMGTGVLTLPWAIGQFVVRDAWMSAAMSMVVSIICAGIVFWFVRMFPQQSLVKGLLTAYGPWLGRLFAGWMLVWVYLLTAMIVRELTLFVEVTVLPRTPIYILAALIVIPTAYTVSLGIEVIGRLAEVLTPVAVMVTGLLLILSIGHFHGQQVTPVLADGWTPVLRGAVVPWGWCSELIISLQIVSHLANPVRTAGKYILFVGTIIALFGVVGEFLITSVLGYQRTSSLFPILEVVRVISVGNFVERLDPLYVMGATALIVLKMSFFHYSLATGTAELFGIKNVQPVVWSGALAIWSGSIFLWKDSATIGEYMLFTVPVYYVSSMLFLPVSASLLQFVRQKLFHTQPPPPVKQG